MRKRVHDGLQMLHPVRCWLLQFMLWSPAPAPASSHWGAGMSAIIRACCGLGRRTQCLHKCVLTWVPLSPAPSVC